MPSSLLAYSALSKDLIPWCCKVPKGSVRKCEELREVRLFRVAGYQLLTGRPFGGP